jgi:acyl-CoA synthetase (AMP-forming)/AMP-acid ligase II
MMLRILEEFETHARADPEADAVRSVGKQPAVVFNRQRLRDCVWKVAKTIHEHCQVGPVLLHYPNRPEYIAGFLGVLAADRTLFPVSSDSAAPEVTSAATRPGASAAIVNAETSGPLRALFRHSCALPELSEEAMLLFNPIGSAAPQGGASLLIFSSGTTHEPKIVRREGAALDAVTQNMIRACGFAESDRVLAAVPLCHSYGLEHGLLAPIAAGSCVHVCERFDLRSVVSELREGGITTLPGVPFMFETLCQSEYASYPTLRKVYSAGAPLPRSTFEAFRKRFGLRIGQVYGATEVGSVTFNDPNRCDFNPDSVGRPMDQVSIRTLHEDQVAVKAPSMLSGYVGESEAPLIDGYFQTGDLGAIDERGDLTITGRMKLLIDVGGRKVNPLEVEAVLSRHPDVGACVVLPMRLSETVQRLKAIITPARPDVEISIQEVRGFAREHLSPYKVPRVFEIRPTLPTSPAGKVLRRLVET